MTEIAHPGSEDRDRQVSDLFERANAAYDSGEFLTAVSLLDEVLSKGVDVVALNNKGAALDAMNRRASAEECYLAAIEASPDYELAWHNLANTLAAQEKHREAAKSYVRAGKLNPGRVANTVGLVESYIGMGRVRRAKAAVASLDALAERDPSVRLTQADLYSLTDAWDDAVRACERFIATDPSDIRGLSRLGGVLHDSGRYVDAVSAYEKALAVSPRDPQIRNDYGYACFCAGDINRALAAFDRAIDLDPRYKHAWYNKGYALHSVDRLEEAVECYRKAVQIDPRDRVLLNNLGNALYNLGRYAESIPMFVRAIGVDPDYEIAWNNIGNALEKMGRYAEAIPFHDRSLEIDPDFDYALYAKGVCKAAIGEPEEGYDLILESLDRNPDYDEAWKARSRVARQLGRMDDALASIERALAVNPNFCEGWTDLGDMLLGTGDGSGADRSYLRALKCIDGAIERDVSDGPSWTRKARILLRLGRYSESLESALHAMVVRHASPSSTVLACDICRIAGVPEVPSEVVAAVEDSEDAETLVAYARLVFSRGETRQAVDLLARRPPSEIGAPGRALLSRCLLELGEVGSAQAVASSCEEPERSVLGAGVSGHIGDWQEAVALLEGAVGYRPADRAVLLSLARGCVAAARPEEAIAAADAAIGVDPLDWEPHEIKADAYRSMGLSERAESERGHAEALMRRCGAWARGEGGV